MKEYKPRIADKILAKRLRSKGAVLIEGPKWCGKTTTAEQIAAEVLYMSDPGKESDNIRMSEIDPQKLLEGKTPLLIDEWQIAPRLWDAIRFEVDHRDDFGQFILTGSAVPASDEHIHHTGTGRFSWILMRPMSLYESKEATGEVSLAELFNNPEKISGTNPLTIDSLAYLICRGGWPKATESEGEDALTHAYDYYEAVVRSDISRVDGIARDPGRIRNLMRSYARNQGSQAGIGVLLDDIASNDSPNINQDTVYSYINALKKIFVIEEAEAWNPNLRSKTAIRTSHTRYYIDPSIAVAALGLGPDDLINDLNTFGFLFETLAIRDLRVFADALNGTVYHYRDKSGLECDAVIHLRNGSYGLVEIKLGDDQSIEEGSRNLKKLAAKIDNTKMKDPSFLMVLNGTKKYAYRRDDGVLVVPIGCLKD